MLVPWLQARALRRDAMEHLEKMKESVDDDKYLVRFLPGDRHNPREWASTRKYLIILQLGTLATAVQIAASINSAADSWAAEKFNVSLEVMSLQTGLFLIGFGLSAPALAPISELHGRAPVYTLPMLILSAFCLGSGFARNIQTRCILRFFAGLFGAAPLSNSGGSVADISNNRQRTFLFMVYSVLAFVGTPLGPILGGWIGEGTNESWCDWTTASFGLFIVIVLFFCMPETLGQELLKHRAQEIRKITGDDRYKTELERKLEGKQHGFLMTILYAMGMPIYFLVREPITLCFSMYLAIVYVVIFGDLECYPLLFGIYGWGSGKIGTVFCSVLVGMMLPALLIPYFNRRYMREFDARAAAGKGPPPPESRLLIATFGTWTLPISLFWAGWTAYRSISPWSMIVSQAFFGFGAIACFIASYLYIMDCYQVNAASPLAAMVFLRYVVAGAGSVLWTRPMFEGIGYHWAMSLLGFLAVAVSLLPVVFTICGPWIRSKSKYAMA